MMMLPQSILLYRWVNIIATYIKWTDVNFTIIQNFIWMQWYVLISADIEFISCSVQNFQGNSTFWTKLNSLLSRPTIFSMFTAMSSSTKKMCIISIKLVRIQNIVFLHHFNLSISDPANLKRKISTFFTSAPPWRSSLSIMLKELNMQEYQISASTRSLICVIPSILISTFSLIQHAMGNRHFQHPTGVHKYEWDTDTDIHTQQPVSWSGSLTYTTWENFEKMLSFYWIH